MTLMSYRQEIAAVRESLAAANARRQQDPDYTLLLSRLEFVLSLISAADEELIAQTARFGSLAAEAHAVHARARAFFHALPVPCLITDDLGIVRSVNRAAAALLWCGRECGDVIDWTTGVEAALIGKPFPLRVPEADRGQFRTRITRARMGENATWDGVILLLAAPRDAAAACVDEPLPPSAPSARTLAAVTFTLTPLPLPIGDETHELLWTLRECPASPLLRTPSHVPLAPTAPGATHPKAPLA
jgi:hypothetical protein